MPLAKEDVVHTALITSAAVCALLLGTMLLTGTHSGHAYIRAMKNGENVVMYELPIGKWPKIPVWKEQRPMPDSNH